MALPHRQCRLLNGYLLQPANALVKVEGGSAVGDVKWNGLSGSGVAVHTMCLFAHNDVQRESEGKEGGRENKGRGGRVFQRIDDNEFSRKVVQVNKVVFVQNSS